jgi:phosphohistidine phosphatase
LILCSTAKRSRQTAELVIEASGFEGGIQFSRDLYHTDPDDIIRVLRMVPEEYDKVMVIGHNPGLEELLELITGEWEKLPTAALAQLRLSVSKWGELDDETQGDLVSLWRPKELR